MASIDIEPPRVLTIMTLLSDESTENWDDRDDLLTSELMTELQIMKVKNFRTLFRYVLSTAKKLKEASIKDTKALNKAVQHFQSIAGKQAAQKFIDDATSIVRSSNETRRIQIAVCSGISEAISSALLKKNLVIPRDALETISAGEARILLKSIGVDLPEATMEVDK